MTSTSHAIIGTVIAAKVGNPALAIPIAITSHYLCDTLPHWDTGYARGKETKTRFITESAIDLVLGFVLSYLVIVLFFPSTNLWYAFLLIILAQLPDWITAPYLFFDWNIPPFNWSYKFGKIFDNELAMPWGVINQVAIVAAVIILGRLL